MLCAQVDDDGRDVVVGESVAERRHFFAAHDELVFNFFVGPLLLKILAEKRRAFFSADAAGAVAVLAALGAEDVGAGEFSGFFIGRSRERCCGDEQGEAYESEFHHMNIVPREAEALRGSYFTSRSSQKSCDERGTAHTGTDAGVETEMRLVRCAARDMC